jgi:hypothetical protein
MLCSQVAEVVGNKTIYTKYKLETLTVKYKLPAMKACGVAKI